MMYLWPCIITERWCLLKSIIIKAEDKHISHLVDLSNKPVHIYYAQRSPLALVIKEQGLLLLID